MHYGIVQVVNESQTSGHVKIWRHKHKKIWNASRICVSSLRRGHANLLCIVPILVYVLPLSEHVYSLAGVSFIFVLSLSCARLW